MKGIIFNAVEEAVTSLYSADVWDDLLEAAHCPGSYTSLGRYDDAELSRLVSAASEATGIEPDDLLRVLGRHSMAHLARRFPHLMEGADDPLVYLQSVNDVIHPEVLKLHTDATPPQFEFQPLDGGALRVTYQSDRGLGALAEGLVAGLGDCLGVPLDVVSVTEPGGPVSVFDVSYAVTD